MTIRTVLTAVFLATAATTALAQAPATPAAPNGALVVSGQDIAKRLDAPPARPGGLVSYAITNADNYRTSAARRTGDGTPELHAHWTDVMLVLAGEVTLTYGGTIVGNTVDASGESHGGQLTGGTTVTLHSGDYVQVPAGLPHLMTGPKDFRYFVTKVHA